MDFPCWCYHGVNKKGDQDIKNKPEPLHATYGILGWYVFWLLFLACFCLVGLEWRWNFSAEIEIMKKYGEPWESSHISYAINLIK